MALNGELALRLLNDPQAPVSLVCREELYGSLALLILTSRWSSPLSPYRRALGVTTSRHDTIHALLAAQHVLGSDLTLLSPGTQASFWLGTVVLVELMPLAATSPASARRRLGQRWMALHRLGPPQCCTPPGQAFTPACGRCT